MKKIEKYIVVFSVLVLSAFAVQARDRTEDVSLLVIPAHYSVVQVAMDLYRMYPTILVSYQAGEDGDDPVLYVWNGRGEWLYVSFDDYLQGRFFSYPPSRAVLVGEAERMPSLLAEGPPWVSQIIKIPTLKTPELLNSLGKVYDFDPYTWKWLARRFNLDLVNLNAAKMKSSWYDGSMIEKPLPDGTVEKVYIPPEGSEIEGMDIEVFEVERKPGVSIPLKAEPPRRAETILIDVERTPDGDYYFEETDLVEETQYDDEGGETFIVEEVYEDAEFAPVITPAPAAPPADEETSVFFEYTEEDMQGMERQK